MRKVKGACLEAAQIVNDWRAKAPGGMETALLLWEQCIVPSLLSGYSTWVEMTPSTEKQLDDLLRWYLRLILQVGPGARLASLQWCSATLGLRGWPESLASKVAPHNENKNP